VAAEVRERLSVSKQAVETFDMERLNRMKLDDIGIMLIIDTLMYSKRLTPSAGQFPIKKSTHILKVHKCSN
jgi:hypothetical protein